MKVATRNEQSDMNVSMPDHYKRGNALSDAPWYTPVVGHAFTGLLKGEYAMQGGENEGKVYYQILLTSPADVVRKEGGDMVPAVAKAGELVNVGYKKALDCLAGLAADEEEYSIWLSPVEKKSIGGGKTFWVIDVGYAPQAREK